MTRVTIDVAVDERSLTKLRSLRGVTLDALPAHVEPWDAPVETDILVCKLPPRNLDQLTRLKLLQISTVGYEHHRHLKLGEKPYPVCNARGMFDTAIAEWNLAMMVNLVRDLRLMIRNQESKHWERLDRFQQELRGRVVGLWGYGGIGRETARLARAFGMTTHVLTRRGVGSRTNVYTPEGTGDPEGVLPHRVFLKGQESEFLSGLDFLILALPHTRESNGRVGEAELRSLPSYAFLLNPSRGPIVCEEALLRALREGSIAGAALDTHFAYPLPPEHPLWTFPNVILTPHISGADKSREFPARMGDLVIQNVKRLLEGQELLNVVRNEDWREAELER